MCKDAVKRDSTCQSICRRLCTVKKIEDFRFPVSRLDDVSSVRMPICPLFHPSGRHVHHDRTPDIPASSVLTLHCVEKLLFQLASVQTSQQPVRTSISDRSASDSFQVQYMGRSTSTVRMMWFPVRTRS
jgi:hypothetical protein